MTANDGAAVRRRALDLRRELQGEEPPPLRLPRVPVELHELVLDAHALGASDEAVQEDILDALDWQYVRAVEAMLCNAAAVLDPWLLTDPLAPGYERVAFINLQMVLEKFRSRHG